MQHLCIRKIEISRWLIGENDLWVHRKRSRNGSSLLFTTGKLAWPVMHSRREPDSSEQLRRFISRYFPIAAANPEWHRNVLEGREFTMQVMKLKHEADLLIS